MSVGPRRTWIIGRADAGQTIAALLRRELNLSWSRAGRAISDGRVRLNGGPCADPARRLRAGDRVEIRDAGGTSSEPPRGPRRSPISKKERPSTLPDGVEEPRVIYADAAIVIVDKPTGLTTMRHAEEAAEFGERGRRFLPATLMDLLPGLLGEPGFRFRAVHRIDRDTSGLVVFARTRDAEKHLANQFRTRTIHRRYLALTRGVPTLERLESRLVRDRGDGRRGSTTDPHAGQRAVTHVRVLEAFDAFALVECRLETGRTHQVRIHLGEHGTPLCGERVYDRPLGRGPVPDGSGARRPMLHAVELGIVHPITREVMRWDAEPPEDFAQLLHAFREPKTGTHKE